MSQSPSQTFKTHYLTSLDQAKLLWEKILGNISDTEKLDYYFYPDYIWLSALSEKNSEPLVICIESCIEGKNNFLWYPVLIRPLPEIYKLSQFDAISPYGFAGPLILTSDQLIQAQLLSEFQKQWQSYCKEKLIIAEFCRFHPLLQNQVGVQWLESHHVKDVVYFDLTVSEETLYERLHSQKRRSLKKADKNQLEFADSLIHEDAFRSLYAASMAQKAADDFYHFSPSYFDQLFELAKSYPEHVTLHSVLHNGEVISSALFFKAGKTVEYFLGANAPEARDLHSSAWLLFQTALKSKAQGYERYVLGGGLQPDDELFRFKQQLSPLTVPYYIGRQIIDAEAYEAIKTSYVQKVAGQNRVSLASAPLFFYRNNLPVDQTGN